MGTPSAGVSAARTRLSRRGLSAGRRGPVAVVSAPQTPLSFGKVAGPGPARLKAETTAHVAANCPFLLMASFQGFVGETGQRPGVLPKQTKVTINGKEVPIGTEFVEIARGGPTPPAGVDVPILIEIKTLGASAYPAGRYVGKLAITIRGG